MVQKRSHTCKKKKERDLPKKKIDNSQKENMAVTTKQEK
jgi:hypothetical protein